MPNVKGALTRKIGPLPAWGWGVALGGTFLVVRLVRGGGSSDNKVQQQLVPTTAPDYQPQQGFLEGLSNQLFDVQTGIDSLRNVQAPQTQPIANAVSPKLGEENKRLQRNIKNTRLTLIKRIGETRTNRVLGRARRLFGTPFEGETAEQKNLRLENRFLYLQQIAQANKPVSAKPTS